MVDVVIARDQAATMRDGVELRADIYRPAGDGPFPALIQRTPYNKMNLTLSALTLDPLRAAAHGYAVVIQDVRGRFSSGGGPFYPYRNEYDDGVDTVEWVAEQGWCDGRIGAYGASYMGATAWLMAAGAPELIGALAPVTAAHDFWANHFRRGGALNLGLLLNWSIAAIGPGALLRSCPPENLPDALGELADQIDAFDALAATAPLSKIGARMHVPDFFDEIRRWRMPNGESRSILLTERCGRINAPALIIAGWRDALLEGDMETYAKIMESAGERARAHTRLIIGPWAHGMFLNVVGEADFGLRANGACLDMKEDLTALQLRWFDAMLSPGNEKAFDSPRVKIFVQGENRWREEAHWPPREAEPTQYFLAVDGALTPTPATDEGARSYAYDPADPAPTRGGPILMHPAYMRGPADQGAWLARSDVLTFTSARLEHDIEVTGDVCAVLFAATSGRDTDWVVKLCEVDESGRTMDICDGVLRARFRAGFERAQSIEPGEAARYEIALAPTSHMFKRGRRICVLVTSSDFPRYDRNPNTGAWPDDAEEFAVAQQTVFCGGVRASHITLPIAKKGGVRPDASADARAGERPSL